MGNQTSQWGQDFKADTERSTYRWIIHFQNGNRVTGYSRKAGKDEISDKVRLLKRKIIMLTKSKNNYFDEKNTKCIEFFGRSALGEYKTELFTMYSDKYILAGNQKFNSTANIISFLNTFYDLVKMGKIGQLDYSVVGYSKVKEEDIFKIDVSRFRDAAHLQKYCSDQIIEGYPLERVEHFQRQIMDAFARNTHRMPNNQLSITETLSKNFRNV